MSNSVKIFKRNHAACVHACKSIDRKLSYGDVQLDELMKMEVAT